MKLCVYGGQYGSEGKGSAAEYLISNSRHRNDKGELDRKLVAVGENSPNSGHTCSLGKTRNIPASAYFADTVILGPDSVVDRGTLVEDLINIRAATGKAPRVYIHEHAAMMNAGDPMLEEQMGVVARVSSTGSGSGAARSRKQMVRDEEATVKHMNMSQFFDNRLEVSIIARFGYLSLIRDLHETDVIFECSQGTLLDVNWGIFPYVTSRTTLPRTAVDRNGVATLPWSFCGVYRTFPIRTGGPSGPTGGKETLFEELGVAPEIATVTKRTRRIFHFSREDFYLSLHLTRPSMVFFTHLDYINVKPEDIDGFMAWYRGVVDNQPIGWRVEGLFLSDSTGKFINHGVQSL